jgi:iron-sulfur cluster repair protein YtfE (RIC family)
MLMEDHKKVKGLFAQAKSGASQQQLFQQIRTELEMHTKIEEAVLYPLLERSAELKPMIQEAWKEHGKVKQMLQSSGTGSDLSSMLAQLEKDVEHHVQEEEGQIFPKARQSCGQQDLDRAAQEMQAMKSSTSMGPAAGRDSQPESSLNA